MKEPEAQKPAAEAEEGFRISEKPVVKSYRGHRRAAAATVMGFDQMSGPASEESLYILARDPKSLFVYWNHDWAERCVGDGSSRRKLHLRVLGEDGREDKTTEIDPAVGFAFVDVSSPATRYTCELGCFEGSEWRMVVHSGSAETPAAAMSDDLAADFATLPFHLSFQRLIDIFRARPMAKQTLAESVSRMQAEARKLQASISEVEWSKLIDTAAAVGDAEAGFCLDGARPPELAALLQTVKRDPRQWIPSPEKLERWKQLGEHFASSSWGGASSGGTSRRSASML